jgi:hypothetical protein
MYDELLSKISDILSEYGENDEVKITYDIIFTSYSKFKKDFISFIILHNVDDSVVLKTLSKDSESVKSYCSSMFLYELGLTKIEMDIKKITESIEDIIKEERDKE